VLLDAVALMFVPHWRSNVAPGQGDQSIRMPAPWASSCQGSTPSVSRLENGTTAAPVSSELG
jgi:hypothetical protein